MSRKQKAAPAAGEKKYTVYGTIAVSVCTVVTANSPEQALERAQARGVKSLCHQCVGGDYDVEWSLQDGLNGDVETGEAGDVEEGG
jgi:hypothetical protein